MHFNCTRLAFSCLLEKANPLAKKYAAIVLAVISLFFSHIGYAQVSKTYTTAGIDSFTVPAGVTSLTAKCIGAGGKGGDVSSANDKGAGGGGGGAFASKVIASGFSGGQKLPLRVGQGATTTSPGQASWFVDSTTVRAMGGKSVQTDNASGASGGNASGTPPPDDYSLGDITRLGGSGGQGDDVSGTYGGGGGSSASPTSQGVGGSGSIGGTLVNAGSGAYGPTSPGNGNNGGQPGGGGSGALGDGSTAYTGGSGANGKVEISFTCPTYILSSTSAAAEICNSVDSVLVNLSASAGDLPVGIYKVTYTVDGGSDQTATFTVSTAGVGSFYAKGLTTVGDRLVTITKLESGESDLCSSTISSNNTVTVHVNKLPVISGTSSICKDSSTQLISDSLPNISNPWISSNLSKATVTSGGLVSAIDSGTVDVYFTDENGCKDTITITITAPPDAGGTITVLKDSVCEGGTINLDSSGTADPGGTWVSSDPSKATVDASSGEVTGVDAGSVTIHYVVYGKGGCDNDTASQEIKVIAPPNAGGTIVVLKDSVCEGGTINLDSSGTADPGGTWVSSDPSKATVDASSGEVTGVLAGQVTIHYVVYGLLDCGNDTASQEIKVIAPPNAGGTIVVLKDSVCEGGTINLDSSGTADPGGTWVSEDPLTATVDPSSGEVTGVLAGQVTIHYVVYGLGGCGNDTASQEIKVIAPPNAGTISGENSVCPDSSTTLNSDGDVGGAWFSSDNFIAIVDETTGEVTGQNAGNTQIYYVVYGVGGCGNDTAFFDISVNAATLITTEPTGYVYYIGDPAPDDLYVETEGTNLAYQWYSNTDSSYIGATLLTGETDSTFAPDLSAADTTYYFVIVNGDCGLPDTSDIVGVQVRLATSVEFITINCPHSGVYSEIVKVRARLGLSDGTPLVDKTVEFRIYNGPESNYNVGTADVVTATTDDQGFAEALMLLTQDPTNGDPMDNGTNAGFAHIRVYFAGDLDNNAAEKIGPYNVRRETAQFIPIGVDPNNTDPNLSDANKIKFNGKLGSGYIVTNNNSVDVTVSVKLQEEIDGMPGKISNAMVQFDLNPSGSTTSTVLYARPNPADSVVTVTFPGVPVGSYGSSSFTLHITVGDYYRAKMNSTLTIHKKGVASLFSGGGDIQIGSSAGKYAADAGSLASFSVGSKYNNQATKVQGKASLIFTSKGRTYEVTGSGTPTVTFDSLGGVASYTSTASIADITLDTSGTGTASVVSPSTLTMTYNLKDSSTDMVSLKVADGSTIWFSNKGTGSTTDRQVLIRGGMTIASNIAAPTATGATRCGSGTVSLSAAPPSGATIDWYDAPTGGTRVQTGSLTYAPFVTASTTYYAEARNPLTNALSVSRAAAVVTVNAQPAAPAASGGVRCGTGTVTLTASPVSNATLAWYSVATSGTVLSTASSYTTPSISTTTTYYVESKSTITACASPTRTAVVATINPLPAAPSASSVSRCGPGAVTLTATPPVGAAVDWYASTTATTPLASGTNSFTTPNLTASTTYYVQSRNTTTGCLSGRIAVTATINAVPAAPSTLTGTLSSCPVSTTSYTFTAAKLSGISYRWTIPSCATGSSTTNSIGVKFSKSGSNDSVFVQTVASNGCASARRGVKVTTLTCTACTTAVVLTNTHFNGAEAAGERVNNRATVSLYPNPARRLFRVQMNGFEEGQVLVTVTDPTGRLVISRQQYVVQGSGFVDLDLQASSARGVYMVSVSQKGQYKVMKLMKY